MILNINKIEDDRERNTVRDYNDYLSTRENVRYLTRRVTLESNNPDNYPTHIPVSVELEQAKDPRKLIVCVTETLPTDHKVNQTQGIYRRTE